MIGLFEFLKVSFVFDMSLGAEEENTKLLSSLMKKPLLQQGSRWKQINKHSEATINFLTLYSLPQKEQKKMLIAV